MPAYELRISDWSSDVCSSDLARRRGAPPAALCAGEPVGAGNRRAMTALPVPAGLRQWTLALATALLLHAGLLVMFHHLVHGGAADVGLRGIAVGLPPAGDRKSTRLNSSH